MLQRFGLPKLNKRQWRAIFINLCLEVTNEYGSLVGTLTLPAILKSLNISIDQLAIIKSVTRLAGIVGVVWALFKDVYGRKIFFQIGIPLATINEIFGGLVFNSSTMILSGVVKTVSPSAPGTVYLVEEIGPERRGAVVSLLAVSVGVGAAIALGLWSLVGNYSWGWRFILIFKSLPLMYIVFMMWCSGEEFIPESLCFAPPQSEGIAAFERPLKSLFLNTQNLKVLLSWSLYNFACTFLSVSLGQFLFIHLSNDCEYNAQSTSILSIVGGLLALPLVYVVGTLSDKFGRIPLAQIMWIISSISYAAFYGSSCDSIWLSIGFLMVICFPQFCLIALTNVVGNEIWKTEHRALGEAVIGVVNSFAGALGFLFYPYLSSIAGGHNQAEVVLSVICGTILPFLLYLIPESSGMVMNNLNEKKSEESHLMLMTSGSNYGSTEI